MEGSRVKPHISIGTVIVGTGFSGLAMAVTLKKAGHSDFLLLEKANEVGGTWRENHYPGAECDVPSSLYSFSFERKPDWDYTWSEQAQILEYLKHSTAKHALYEHIHFGCELASARFVEDNTWLIHTRQGETISTRHLIIATGQLHHPQYPTIKGQAAFAGPQFHSARWQHDVDYRGKRVAVIGNAASAVQFIPELAKSAAQLTVFQRSANWVSRKLDRPRRPWEQALIRYFPVLDRLARLNVFLRNELIVFPAMKGNRLSSTLLRLTCSSYLNSTIKDPSLREQLTPDYPIGAKRVLVVDGYYEALAQDNVALETSRVCELDGQSILTESGKRHTADIIIYGTGFVTNPFLKDLDIQGRGGIKLAEHWRDGAHAYLGMQTAGFPNMFLMYGPNTNLGHNSIVLMSEAQAGYIQQAISHLEQQGYSSIDVSSDVESRFNVEIQERLKKMVWQQIEDSWYKDGSQITHNWPGRVMEYQRRTRRFQPQNHHYT
ncbi:MAG: cation diffusion facilitator CzcD-associated flavoprotein CzcO [Paracoccaceae bacterium]|jgi:cation diffusion facilitator CzcD-associated flavoprotein CzcO